MYLKSALSKTNGNVSEASKLAGIGRATFYKKLGLDEQDDWITEITNKWVSETEF